MDKTPRGPPPLPASPVRKPVNRRPLPVAVGAFALVLVVVGTVALAMRSPVDESRDAVVAPDTSPETASTDEQAPAMPLPRFTLDLPGWSIVGINHSDLPTAAIFSKGSTEEGREQAVIVVSSDGPDDPPGTGYAAALAAHAEAENLGTVSIDGFTAQAFRYGGEYPDYEFLWQNTETVMVQIVVLGVDYDEATEIVAAVSPITEETWTELAAQFPQTEMTTTTVAPVVPGSAESSGEPIPLFPRFVIDLPGFEVIGGSEGQVGPAHWYGEWDILVGDTMGTIFLDSDQTTPSQTFAGFDTTEQVAIAGSPGLLGRHDDGFIVEWADLDTRFTVSVDGTEIDPIALVEAINYVDDATWMQVLANSGA